MAAKKKCPTQLDRIEQNQARVLSKLDALRKQGEKLMSKISEYVDKQLAHNKDIDKHLDGISAGIGDLKKTIADLQNSQGSVTAEDQALLDKAEAQAQALEDKAHAMDTLQPPTPPPAP